MSVELDALGDVIGVQEKERTESAARSWFKAVAGARRGGGDPGQGPAAPARLLARRLPKPHPRPPAPSWQQNIEDIHQHSLIGIRHQEEREHAWDDVVPGLYRNVAIFRIVKTGQEAPDSAESDTEHESEDSEEESECEENEQEESEREDSPQEEVRENEEVRSSGSTEPPQDEGINDLSPESVVRLQTAMSRGQSAPLQAAFERAALLGGRALEALHRACAGPARLHPTASPRPRLYALSTLGLALMDAFIAQLPHINNEQVMIDFQCLVSANEYLVELYKGLAALAPPADADERRRAARRLVDIVRAALAAHRHYSDKNVRLTRDFDGDLMYLAPLLRDSRTIYMRYLTYCMYEMYYRQLDYNIATVILDNLHSLKTRLKLPPSAYQEIECALFYFIYRADQDWLHYVTENRPQYLNLLMNQDKPTNIKVLYDPDRLLNGPVIYLEWKKFRDCLANFDEVLARVDLDTDLRAEDNKLEEEEVLCLSQLPRLRDWYSLRKMSEYLSTAEGAGAGDALVTQRAAQVAGELLADSAQHLAASTRELLAAELPAVPLHRLTQLRNELSKARDGKLLAKVQLEMSQPQLFAALARDLAHVRRGLDQVARLYSPLAARALVRDGLQLLEARREQWPRQLMPHYAIIEHIFSMMPCFDKNIGFKMESDFVDKHIKPLGHTRQLFREIGCVCVNISYLRQEWERHHRELIKVCVEKLHTYVERVRSAASALRGREQAWGRAWAGAAQLGAGARDQDPVDVQGLKKDVLKIKTKTQADAAIKNKVLDILKTIDSGTEEWDEIIHLLEFIVKEVGFMNDHVWEIKNGRISNIFQNIKLGKPNEENLDRVECLLGLIVEEATSKYCDNGILPVPEEAPEHRYEGIEGVWAALRGARAGGGGGEALLRGLVERAGVVRAAVGRTAAADELRAALAGDARRRLQLEAALADVHQALYDAKLGSPSKRPAGRLLAEYPLRLLLAHGNAIVEGVGACLDPHESLADAALEAAADEACWREILALRLAGVHAEDAAQLLPLSAAACGSPRWRRYLQLLPRGAPPPPHPHPALLHSGPHLLLFLSLSLLHLLPGALPSLCDWLALCWYSFTLISSNTI